GMTLRRDMRAVASGIVAVATAVMARALKRVSVARGVDPRRMALIPFGGAGPLFGCALADALGMRTVVVPPHPGALSALGLAAAAERVGAVVCLRVVGERGAPPLEFRSAPLHPGLAPGVGPPTRREIVVRGETMAAVVRPLDSLPPGLSIAGPAVLAGGDATALIEPGWLAT